MPRRAVSQTRSDVAARRDGGLTDLGAIDTVNAGSARRGLGRTANYRQVKRKKDGINVFGRGS